jgi:glutathione S-transferase
VKPHLIALSYSPWSICARWALDHHGIDYGYTQYTPMLGEPWLRVKTGRFRGQVTVPALLTPTGTLMDSYAIAKWADERGEEEPLIGAAVAEVDVWNDRADALLAAGRILVTAAVARDPEAILESVPATLRRLPGCVAIGRMGARYLLRKYAKEGSEADQIEAMRGHLEALRAALGDRETVLEAFSYADVAMATSLQMLRPPAGRKFALGPASRRAWSLPELAADFEDLLTWRDNIYEQRPPRRR